VESIKSKYISHFIASSALLSKAGALTSARLLPPKIGPDGSLFAGLDVQAPGFPVSFLRDQFRARSTRCVDEFKRCYGEIIVSARVLASSSSAGFCSADFLGCQQRLHYGPRP
jgi:hypothetical protein